jgi:hypothetical protein
MERPALILFFLMFMQELRFPICTVKMIALNLHFNSFFFSYPSLSIVPGTSASCRYTFTEATRFPSDLNGWPTESR